MDQEEFFSSRLADQFTLRDIAERLGESLSNVKQTVEKHHVHQVRRVGVIRLFGPAELIRIRRLIELDRKSQIGS